MAFSSERDMVEAIKTSTYLQNLISTEPRLIREEVKGYFGVPDLVVVGSDNEKQIAIAFEAKLSNWRRALFQAFRYKAFVNKSYVIMDDEFVNPALSQKARFKRSNIGLLSIDHNGSVHCHYDPYYESPYSSQLESKFNISIENFVRKCPDAH